MLPPVCCKLPIVLSCTRKRRRRHSVWPPRAAACAGVANHPHKPCASGCVISPGREVTVSLSPNQNRRGGPHLTLVRHGRPRVLHRRAAEEIAKSCGVTALAQTVQALTKRNLCSHERRTRGRNRSSRTQATPAVEDACAECRNPLGKSQQRGLMRPRRSLFLIK